jgi:hypothetical protein
VSRGGVLCCDERGVGCSWKAHATLRRVVLCVMLCCIVPCHAMPEQVGGVEWSGGDKRIGSELYVAIGCVVGCVSRGAVGRVRSSLRSHYTLTSPTPSLTRNPTYPTVQTPTTEPKQHLLHL